MICMSLIDPLSRRSCRSGIKVRMSHRDVEIVGVNPAGHVNSAEIYQQIIFLGLEFILTIFDAAVSSDVKIAKSVFLCLAPGLE